LPRLDIEEQDLRRLFGGKSFFCVCGVIGQWGLCHRKADTYHDFDDISVCKRQLFSVKLQIAVQNKRGFGGGNGALCDFCARRFAGTLPRTTTWKRRTAATRNGEKICGN